MLLTDKYADKIYGIITCYDRMIIQEYIPNWSHAEAMTTYIKFNDIRIFDYPSFSQLLTEVHPSSCMTRQNSNREWPSHFRLCAAPDICLKENPRAFPSHTGLGCLRIIIEFWDLHALKQAVLHICDCLRDGDGRESSHFWRPRKSKARHRIVPYPWRNI